MDPSPKTFPRWLKVLIAGAAVVGVLSIAKDIALKIVLEKMAGPAIGAKVQIGGAGLGICSQRVRLTAVRVYNPPGFPQDVFLSLPEVRVDVDMPELLKGRLHFPLIVFHLEKLVAIKNAQGKLNIDELKIVQEKLKENNKGPAPQFKIDELKLNIGKVIYVDETAKPRPVTQAYELALRGKTLRNLDSPQKLVAAVLVEALKPTAIRSAGMLAAGTLLGVGFLPGLALGVIVAEDSSSVDAPRPFERTYAESLNLVRELGTVKKEDRAAGRIYAKVYGCDVIVNIEKRAWGKSHIKIKARKYLLAKPQIAAGILYQLMERLK